MVLILHYHPLCPHSRKTRAILGEKKVDFHLKLEKPWERNEEFLAINPSGITPALSIENGMTIYGNNTITEYIEEQYKNLNLLGESTEKRAFTRCLTEWFDFKFYNEVTKYIINEKVIKVITNTGAPNSDAIRAAKQNALYHIDYIEYRIANSQAAYLVGDHVTIADFAAFAQLSVLDYLNDVPWSRSETVRMWYALIKSRSSIGPILRETVSPIKPPLHYTNPDF